MTNFGFKILSLSLEGKSLRPAVVNFTDGLNVITGASNTGKSFILNCIDYMFGAGEIPKSIPEAELYESVHLTIKTNGDNKKYHLKRALHKFGVVTVSSSDDTFILQPKLDSKSNKDNISLFLLRLTGLVNKKVRTNKKNSTDNLSFRDLAHLCLIHEEKIITEKSPIFTSRKTAETKAKSVFSLLLTNIDDSELIPIEDDKLSKAKQTAKIELLEDIIQNFSSGKDFPNLLELKEQINRLELYYRSLENQTLPLKIKITLQEKERQKLWKNTQYLSSTLHTKKVLLERFDILGKKYKSDLERLNSTIEANTQLDGLPSTNCFFCESLPEHQKKTAVEQYDFNIIERSCLYEIKSIEVLKKELNLTMNEVQEVIYQLNSSLDKQKLELESIESEIEDNLKPKINKIVSDMKSTQDTIFEKKDTLKDIERLNYLNNKVVDIQNLVVTKTEPSYQNDVLINNKIEDLCKEIEYRLIEWGLFDNTRITFNYDSKIWDYIISGHERKTYGKGVRALTYTAFSLALLKYCIKKHLPHPGLVIVDSPLVVFKEPEPDIEGKEKNIKYNFFNDILLEFKNEQVIIFENEDVPENLKSSMHIIEFTKNQNTGRYGFIPVI